ncbi:hypothetical protein [Vibrio sp. SCSIO 43136]|uniref:hypothetical protein n=1 Tax=Vibrio sp. SCSIO 43136 TaxID=2819101 RepID=UPI002074CEF3|nr:hypothetical protein [Vibrio sp. SCSIO 43136]USD67848.1 hypothetical protein J4N39_16825 [Vibrio sp. SCSIO 43136]
MRQLALLTLLLPAVSFAFQSGNYPTLAYSKLPDGQKVVMGDNVIAAAIENKQVQPLQYTAEYKQTLKSIFSEVYKKDDYLATRLESRSLFELTQKMLSEVVCSEYRFRHSLPMQQGCTGQVFDDTLRQPMPFISGPLFEQGLTLHKDDPAQSVSFQLRLSSGIEAPLTSTFGAIHELGPFFGGLARSDNLVLSVRMKAYTLDSDKMRSQAIYPNELIFFVLLPTARELTAQASMRDAARYALQRAQLLVLK